MEKRNLYDKNKKQTQETILATEETPENRYILVVLALIENSKKEILVQKRSKQKGGEYGLTAGHVKQGESSIQGIVSEIKEKLGIDIAPQELKLVYSERNDQDRCFYDLYYLSKDCQISEMKLQKEEVESVKWCSQEEINNLCSKGEFKTAHVEAFEILKPIINSSN